MMKLEHAEHPLVRVAGALVYFDTGAPQSLIPVNGAPWVGALGVSASAMTDSAVSVLANSQAVLARLTGGLRLNALVGMDLIAKHGLLYDLETGQLGWGISPTRIGGSTCLMSDLVINLPVIDIYLGRRRLRAIIDTGCHMDGYFTEMPETSLDAGVISDDSPFIGPFTVAARLVETSLLTTDYSKIALGQKRFGIAPSGLASALKAMRVDGVVGPTICRSLGPVAFIERSVFICSNHCRTA
jgi:hypothetical protein